jgi:HAE1 family hydrophobic/amphiphilic exporter-1
MVCRFESSLKEPKPTLGVHINRVLASDLVYLFLKLRMRFDHIAGDNVTTWEDRDAAKLMM